LDESKEYIMKKVQFPSTEFLLGEQPFQSYYGFHSTDFDSDSYEYSIISHENYNFCGDMSSIIEIFKKVEIYPMTYTIATWNSEKVETPKLMPYQIINVPVERIKFIEYDTRTILIEFPLLEIPSS